jgi:hypothetical protein
MSYVINIETYIMLVVVIKAKSKIVVLLKLNATLLCI